MNDITPSERTLPASAARTSPAAVHQKAASQLGTCPVRLHSRSIGDTWRLEVVYPGDPGWDCFPFYLQTPAANIMRTRFTPGVIGYPGGFVLLSLRPEYAVPRLVLEPIETACRAKYIDSVGILNLSHVSIVRTGCWEPGPFQPKSLVRWLRYE